ncbi:MAG: hypothetical protein BYD32DRAFT_97322 [Podila humilis]|nr:MAG: hypothetical protein BYD32DRAFT_97322 [Podila humilis]
MSFFVVECVSNSAVAHLLSSPLSSLFFFLFLSLHHHTFLHSSLTPSLSLSLLLSFPIPISTYPPFLITLT